MLGAEIVILEPSFGEDAVWHPGLNIVTVSPRLDAAGRERALDELQAEWRRSLRFDAAPECPLSA